MSDEFKKYQDVIEELHRKLLVDPTKTIILIKEEFEKVQFPNSAWSGLVCLLKSGKGVTRELIALGVLVGLLVSGQISLFKRGAFLNEKQFIALAKKLTIGKYLARLLYRLLLSHWVYELPGRQSETPTGKYLALIRNGFTSRESIIKTSPLEFLTRTKLSAIEVRQLYDRALRGTPDQEVISMAMLFDKGEDRICCPPFADVRWQDRFNYLGTESSLSVLVESLKANIVDSIKAIYAHYIPSDMVETWHQYRLGDATLQTLGAGNPLESLEDLNNMTTQPEVTGWLQNIRNQIAVIRQNLKITQIYCRITTGEDSLRCGGGDGESVLLDLLDQNGNALMNVAPPHPGSYDDGGLAHKNWGTADILTPATNPFAIRSIRLSYSSGNGWLFESAKIFLFYDVNYYSSRLVGDQNDDTSDSWDLIHNDQESGWVYDGRSFNFSIQPTSRLSNVQRDFDELERILSNIEEMVSIAQNENFYLVNGADIVNDFKSAAEAALNGGPSLARSKYQAILDILSHKRDIDNFDRELYFAVHSLISDTYSSEGSPSFAYGHLREAWNYLTTHDNESRAYLWMRLAEIFLHWGDQLYAAAGSNFENRLMALPYYRKVSDSFMKLTYADGAEDEVLDIWLDLSRRDGKVPKADKLNMWMKGFSFLTSSAEAGYGLGVSLEGSDVFTLPSCSLPILGYEIIGAKTSKAFLRIQFDVREANLLRHDLNFFIVESKEGLTSWQPKCAKLQVRYARYNPLTTNKETTLFGTGRDLASFRQELGTPFAAEELCYWKMYVASEASLFAATICRPGGCIARLFQMKSSLSSDQIRAHLNLYGVHDEYVPNGRFQNLNRTAQSLAERAAQFASKHLDFLSRAESAVLDEMDAVYVAELACENVTAAELRKEQANTGLQAAYEKFAAAGYAVGESDRILREFKGSYQMGLGRVLNNVSLGASLDPMKGNVGVGVTVNVGGLLGTLAGTDGYDEQFTTQEMQYEANKRQLEANLESLYFQKQLAEIEVTLSEQTLQIERLQQRHAEERLQFLNNRQLTATFWYEMARIYRDMAKVQVLTAARWAWFAERALEFETNISIDILRMDYHLEKAGADRLLKDLDRQRLQLVAFRERYRDVPNIIEREFRFSTDFPEQFRALTSTTDAAPVVRLGHGVRAVEFQTPIYAYDVRLPGRYSFARIMGVEIEFQTDVSSGIFTGHLENAKIVETVNADGTIRRNQLSLSLVRVPRPQALEDSQDCPPYYGLDNNFPCSPVNNGSRCDFPDAGLFELDWKFLDPRLQDILDLLIPVNPRLTDAEGPLFFTRRSEIQSLLSQYNPGVIGNRKSAFPGIAADKKMRELLKDIKKLLTALQPVAWAIWKYSGQENRQGGIIDKKMGADGSALLKRAYMSGVSAYELIFISRELASDKGTKANDKNSQLVIRKRRLHQLDRLSKHLFGNLFTIKHTDLDALLELRDSGYPFSNNMFTYYLKSALKEKRGKTWKNYSVKLNPVRPERFIPRDLSPGIGAVRRCLFDSVPDYVDYSGTGLDYVLRVKHHDAESLSLSSYSRRDDGFVYNPYNSQDQLGVFENTGIDSFWRLTLRALPANALNPTPQWDKIRDIIFRVWYHAAYERYEGFRLAEVVESQAIRRAARKTLEISFYKDFYDEFQTLLGDYDRADPLALAAVRAFTNVSHDDTNGWISFEISEGLVPQPGQRIATALLIFVAAEPSVFPNYTWQLRYGQTGPVFTGQAAGGPMGELASLMSRTPSNGFGGLDPRGIWYFKLSSADNPGFSLASLIDIRFVLEFEPI